MGSGEQLSSLCWKELQSEKKLKAGTVLNVTDTECGNLQIDGNPDALDAITLLTIENPQITAQSYAIIGQVRYENVQGPSYLELLNYFNGAGPFFSRTLAEAGPSRSIAGSSPWRDFSIPFMVNDGSKRIPNRLDLNVRLIGKGSLWLRSVKLIQYADQGDVMNAISIEASSTKHAWWSTRQAGLVGGIAGTILGCMGALVGMLSSLGRMRKLAQGTAYSMLVIGLCSLSAGITAISVGQPYAVYYPLMLIGILGTLVPTFVLRAVRLRFQALDMRRMNSLD